MARYKCTLTCPVFFTINFQFFAFSYCSTSGWIQAGNSWFCSSQCRLNSGTRRENKRCTPIKAVAARILSFAALLLFALPRANGCGRRPILHQLCRSLASALAVFAVRCAHGKTWRRVQGRWTRVVECSSPWTIHSVCTTFSRPKQEKHPLQSCPLIVFSPFFMLYFYIFKFYFEIGQ